MPRAMGNLLSIRGLVGMEDSTAPARLIGARLYRPLLQQGHATGVTQDKRLHQLQGSGLQGPLVSLPGGGSFTAKETSRRFTWRRPRCSRQPLTVKIQAIAAVSGGGCSSIDSSLRDKGKVDPRRGSTHLHPTCVDYRLDPQTDLYLTPPQDIRGGSAPREGEKNRNSREFLPRQPS